MGTPKYPIHLMMFQSRYGLTSTFLRFQEHYEGPEHRGRAFSLEEYMDWYAKHCSKEKNFTYYSDWSGMNIPSWVLEPFKDGLFDPLAVKEKDLLIRYGGVEGPFYLIGIFGKKIDASTLKHEVTHGLFYTSTEYRCDVLSILSQWDVRPIHESLKAMGYCQAVADDETNSYVLTGLAEDRGTRGEFKKHGVSDWAYGDLRKELAVPFKDHFGYSMARISVPDLMKKIHVDKINR